MHQYGPLLDSCSSIVGNQHSKVQDVAIAEGGRRDKARGARSHGVIAEGDRRGKACGVRSRGVGYC